MNRRSFIFLCLIAPFAPTVLSAAEHKYLIGTASPGGTFHPVGVALATLVKAAFQEGHQIELNAVTTAGSAENIRLMRDGEVQFGILQGLFGHDARTGRGEFADLGPDHMLRSVTALWPNVEQFVVRKEDVSTGTIVDLLQMKGKRVAFGDRGSGTLASSRFLLRNLGADLDRDYHLVHLGYGPAADALQKGDVSAIALPAGVPTKALARLKADMGDAAEILSFREEQALTADGGLRLWHPYQIPANTYPGQRHPVMSIAQPNFLAVRADISKQHVYLVVRAVFENLSLLRSMHHATDAVSLDSALSGLPLPLHPGAALYFREKGVEIPADLIVD